MEGKPKISPDHTYVFEDSDLEQLDELSLTGMLDSAELEALLDTSDEEPTVEAEHLDETVEPAGSEPAEILIDPELLQFSDSDD